MKVKLKVGRYAGEIREIPYHLAKILLNDDRAVKVEDPTFIGGGWWQLPDGTKIRGKEAAYAASEG